MNIARFLRTHLWIKKRTGLLVRLVRLVQSVFLYFFSRFMTALTVPKYS